MQLSDGLTEYKKDSSYWEFTLELEKQAKEVLLLFQKHYNSDPTREILKNVKDFLLKVEYWKAMCIQEQIGLANRNSEKAIWEAFHQALNAQTDLGAIRSIMSLSGFGSSKDPETGLRRAKRATAVLRFLNPCHWGVVDWRTIAILKFLEDHNFNIDKALAEAKKEKHSELRKTLDLINEDWACEINQKYRKMRTLQFPRAADIDMALFGLSLIAWPK